MQVIVIIDSADDMRRAEVVRTQFIRRDSGRVVVQARVLGGPDDGKIGSWDVPPEDIHEV